MEAGGRCQVASVSGCRDCQSAVSLGSVSGRVCGFFQVKYNNFSDDDEMKI